MGIVWIVLGSVLLTAFLVVAGFVAGALVYRKHPSESEGLIDRVKSLEKYIEELVKRIESH
ncbi:hypothetical protein [Escherichia coli]|uniref:hypothetical protein n=1 Tax=Escherichia coli TaxID=562 RepID=UPI00135F1040|nr:hypothetical protein [Escherichia coli]MXF06701.1 hypothetical protein [Escherichia coli]